MILQPPVVLESFKLVTGNLEHPSDRSVSLIPILIRGLCGIYLTLTFIKGIGRLLEV